MWTNLLMFTCTTRLALHLLFNRDLLRVCFHDAVAKYRPHSVKRWFLAIVVAFKALLGMICNVPRLYRHRRRFCSCMPWRCGFQERCITLACLRSRNSSPMIQLWFLCITPRMHNMGTGLFPSAPVLEACNPQGRHHCFEVVVAAAKEIAPFCK